MQKNNRPRFSQIVCSPQSVQDAFALHRPMRFWWNVILKLHGKPIDPTLSQVEKTKRVAEGFKFYAWLYRGLAVIFLLFVPTFLAIHFVENSMVSPYWAVASLLTAVYLWSVSGLGYAGAEAYSKGENQGAISLIAFMVMIVAFLSMFVAVVSVAAQHSARMAAAPNLLIASSLFVFGVGSYMIEIIYLATERQA